MRVLIPALLCLSGLGLSAEAPLAVGRPEPPAFDLRATDVQALLPVDARDPAQVERARARMNALVSPYRLDDSVRLLLPRSGDRERLLLAASQALKAQNPNQKVYLAFDSDGKALWDETAWGALDGGILLPGDLGPDPAQWERCLTRAQELLPGRPWSLWLSQDPGPYASILLGDGGRLVVPLGGPAARLATQIPPGFTEVEGGQGVLTLTHPGTGEPRTWRFESGGWRAVESPRTQHEVAVTAREAYDVGALLARVRAKGLQDRSALRELEASLAMDLHIQEFGGAGTDLGYRFRYFQKAGEPEEMLQKEVLFNGVRANLKGQAQLPIIEAKTSAALPVALALTERYRYQDGGSGPRPGTRWIAFNPADGDSTLYAGQILVDETSGRILEERSHRAGLPGLVKSESRAITYGEPSAGLWSLQSLESQERWFLSGEAVLVQRRMTLSEFKANGTDFEGARQSARASTSAMMVQTTDGLRYYTRHEDGSRQVDGRSRTAGRAVGGFLLIDPSSDFPVAPMAAMLFYDFDAWGKGIQYNFLTALVYNAGSISVPNAFMGFDVNAGANLLFLKGTDRPVRDGKLLDREGVGRRTQRGSLSIGHDLGLGFRFRVDGAFELNQYSEASDEKYRSPGFVLPPSGLDQRYTGTLSWQGHGLMMQAGYGLGHRPEGVYGLPDAITSVPDQGQYRQWHGLAGYNLDLGSGQWLDFGVGHLGGRGFDRFKSLGNSGMNGDGMPPGIKGDAIVADRADYGRVGYVVPTGPNLRLTFTLHQAFMRSMDDRKTYGFTGLGLTGDLPGFWWFTTTRLDLGIGLHSQIHGLCTVTGMVSLLRVF